MYGSRSVQDIETNDNDGDRQLYYFVFVTPPNES